MGKLAERRLGGRPFLRHRPEASALRRIDLDGNRHTQRRLRGTRRRVGSCPTNVWAVGDGVWHFDGASWTRLTPPRLFLSVSGTGPDDVWAAGGDVVRLLQTNTCGDGWIAPNEDCDPPQPGSPGVPVCDATCHIPTCGNLRKFDPGETCDPPDGVSCDAQCHLPVRCGDGRIDPGEECDPALTRGFDQHPGLRFDLSHPDLRESHSRRGRDLRPAERRHLRQCLSDHSSAHLRQRQVGPGRGLRSAASHRRRRSSGLRS